MRCRFRSALGLGALILLAASAVVAFAAEPRRIDMSMAWFKPELKLNNRPEVCDSIFGRYIDYFASTEENDPLKPIFARGEEEHKPGSMTRTIRELEWSRIERVRVAQWQQDGGYLGVVERGQSIGWRPPSYSYFLIDKPITDADAERADSGFGAGQFGYLRETNKDGLLDVVYESDARYKDYRKNISVGVAHVFSAGGRVYLGLMAHTFESETEPGPPVYLIVRVITPRRLQAVCRITTLPSRKAIRAEANKIPHYKHFESVVEEIMGEGGNCGTLNSHGRAANELREGLATLMVRPWAYAASTRFFDFSEWGYSGPWNYRKHREFLAVLPKAQQALAEKYARDYKLDRKRALATAEAGIRAVLGQAFSHGRAGADMVHRLLLEGASVNEVSSHLPAQETAKPSAGDSLLPFAIGHPHLVEYLLRSGWDPNAPNAFGKTPLMYAAQFNDLESAKLLARYGANTEMATTRPFDSCYHTIDTHGLTVLHYAVRYASKNFIEWLVEAGAVTAAADSNQHSPLDYLTRFGGLSGYQRHAPLSYGQQNALLAKQDIDSLSRLLKPLGIESRRLESEEANRRAESSYQGGQLQQAYASIKRSLSLNPANDRAMANLSLIALRLGHLGESAKAATYAIQNAKSRNEIASAYFNLGLACRAEGAKGYHYRTIIYDGVVYCQESWDSYRGTLYYYLEAHRISPTTRRADAIVEFLGEADPEGGKWLCKAPDPGAEPRAVYVARNHIYFLTKTAGEVEFRRLGRRERNTEHALQVKRKESFPLGNGLSVSRWQVDVSFQGALVLGNQLCGRYLGSLIEDTAQLVELHTQRKNDQIRVSAVTSRPIVLVLYGNDANWTVAKDSRNIRAIYVHGQHAKLEREDRMPAAVHMDTKQYVHPQPWGSSFNPYTAMTIGLTISAIVDSTDRPQIRLDDSALAGLPPCEGRVRTNCKPRYDAPAAFGRVLTP